jgi:hypothetical protein
MKSKEIWPLPKAFDPEGEANRSLARFKASRLTKWNVNRPRSLRDMHELAVSLEALGRRSEALEIASFPYGKFEYRDEGEFRISLGACLAEACLLLISAGRRDEAIQHIEVLIKAPHNAAITFTAEYLDGILKDLEYALVDPENKNQLLRLASIASLSECTTRLAEWEANLANTDWYPVERLRTTRKLALERLRGLL